MSESSCYPFSMIGSLPLLLFLYQPLSKCHLKLLRNHGRRNGIKSQLDSLQDYRTHSSSHILFPQNRDAGISYCRLLLHDTMLRQGSLHTGVSDTPMCKCGMEHESAEHVSFRCPEHHAARSVMIDDIDMILSTSKCKSAPTLHVHCLNICSWHRTGTVTSVTRSSAIAGRPCDAKACQG